MFTALTYVRMLTLSTPTSRARSALAPGAGSSSPQPRRHRTRLAHPAKETALSRRASFRTIMSLDDPESMEPAHYPVTFDPSPWAESTPDELAAAEAEALAALMAYVPEEARDGLLAAVNPPRAGRAKVTMPMAIQTTDAEFARLLGTYKSIQAAAEMQRMEAEEAQEY